MKRASVIIIFVAIVMLIALSLCPWERWSGGRLKSFNLFGELLPYVPDSIVGTTDNIDPELASFVEHNDTARQDTVVTKKTVIDFIPADFSAPRINDMVAIEDYSFDGDGLERLSKTLCEGSSRKVRIAMLGDSYIEGDILAQDIRAGLQTRYGGCGVGYVAAFSPFPGFRSSVNQAASGWTEHEIRKMKNDPLRTIIGTYFTAEQGADTRLRKSVKPEHLDAWQHTMVVFQADSSGHITLSGPEFEEKTFAVASSTDVQSIVLDAHIGDVRLTTDIPALKVLGIWLEGQKGIVLDGISLRGNSGVSHRSLNAPTTEKMRQFVDYDIIILEFGMNALSTQQTDYTSYGNAMTEVVNNLSALYPNAQILIMGVGDRGQKSGGEVRSMSTTKSLVRAQRDVARRTGSLFWDTREAMGGDGAAFEWNQRKLLNSDFVHLNHRGGKALADIFLNSLDASLQNK